MRVPRVFVPLLLATLLAGCGADPAALSSASGGTLGAQAVSDADQQQVQTLESAVDKAVPEPVLFGNSLLLHIDGSDAYSALRNLIASARKSLWFETFIWHDDETGDQIAQLLVDRAAQGVDVRVLVDAMGSTDGEAGGHDRGVLQTFIDHQIPFRLYNPAILQGANVHITHRKVYLADGDHAMTGGMNIGDEYAHTWHDLLVETRGPAARQLHREFIHDWNTSGAGPAEDLSIPGPEQAASYGTKHVRVTVTSPDENRTEIADSLYAAIDAAKKRINILHVYFSDPALMTHLEGAARRGVDVRLILPTINDSKTYRYLNRYWGEHLMEAGAHVRLYDLRYSHVKFMSIDGVYTALGSANADTRSFQENQELTLMCSDPAFAKDTDTRLFDADWALSRLPLPVDLDVPLYAQPMLTLANLMSYYL